MTNTGHSIRVGDRILIDPNAGVWDYGGSPPAEGALVTGVFPGDERVTARFEGWGEPDEPGGPLRWCVHVWDFDVADVVGIVRTVA